MIPMLLVVGSFVPASDSPELTTTPVRSAVGATVTGWDLIRPGMTRDEVLRLLGKPSKVQMWGNTTEVFFSDTYAKFGVIIRCHFFRVTDVIRTTPDK